MNNGINTVVKILMDRDGDSKEEAEERLLEVKRLMIERVNEGEMYVEDLLADIGLEPDYIMDIFEFSK